jgi:5-methylcytosine-specific restriction endonuclease McrA
MAKRNKRIEFNCDYCGEISSDSQSHYNRKKRHFCSMKCYSLYRIELLPFLEQNAYKGVRKEGENKQVYHRNYCKNNPENISHLKARRYAREKNAEGSHTLLEWQNLKQKHDNKCAKCNKEKKLTKDHIIPLSEGGSDYIENIQPLCQNCNSKKWKHIYQNSELLNL